MGQAQAESAAQQEVWQEKQQAGEEQRGTLFVSLTLGMEDKDLHSTSIGASISSREIAAVVVVVVRVVAAAVAVVVIFADTFLCFIFFFYLYRVCVNFSEADSFIHFILPYLG